MQVTDNAYAVLWLAHQHGERWFIVTEEGIIVINQGWTRLSELT